MKTFERKGVTVSVFQGDEDLSTIHQLQDKFGLAGLEKNKLLFVSLEGTDDKYLHPDRFIVKNYTASLTNHFMWEGLLTQEEQNERLYHMIDTFIDTGKQYIIEDYKFVEDEPFYDYSGGRE
jgi:cytochrome oxidase Cu insertion factor (SCO1/SenC/PrrC family)